MAHDDPRAGEADASTDFAVVEEGEQPVVVRDERALVALEVAFQTPGDAVRAYSENVGVGLLALTTNQTLRKGSELTLRVRVPGWTTPLLACGKVTWSRPDAMGIAFLDLALAEQDRFRKLVLAHTTMLERMRRQFSRQVEQPVAALVSTRRTALVRLQNELFSDVVAELLNENGYVAVSDFASGSKPNVIVAEPTTAGLLQGTFKLVPLVLVNSNNPNELARARMPQMRARAYVPRPASAGRILQALQQVFHER
jgi:hypothetical protein